jgi:hypothetical protein
MTVLVTVSITDTVPELRFVTYRRSPLGLTATNWGNAPTEIVAITDGVVVEAAETDATAVAGTGTTAPTPSVHSSVVCSVPVSMKTLPMSSVPRRAAAPNNSNAADFAGTAGASVAGLNTAVTAVKTAVVVDTAVVFSAGETGSGVTSDVLAEVVVSVPAVTSVGATELAVESATLVAGFG